MNKSVLLVLVVTGCVAQPDSASDVSVPRIIANSLPPSALAGSALTTVQLTTASAADMAPTAAARTVLGYAVGCALGGAQSVSVTSGGVTTVLTGAMGMAPAWTTRALTSDEAAWVSACVFARVNLTATSVTISARGDLAALSAGATELADFQIEEGAFWGNAFVDVGAITAYACDGADQLANDSYGDLPNRQCAQPDGVSGSGLTPCGFHYAGACASACLTVSAPYTDCSAGGAATAQVVTAFLYGTPPY